MLREVSQIPRRKAPNSLRQWAYEQVEKFAESDMEIPRRGRQETPPREDEAAICISDVLPGRKEIRERRCTYDPRRYLPEKGD